MILNLHEPSVAFAAIALAAVSWDGVLTPAGARSLRHALDYRHPYSNYDNDTMVQLMDQLLRELRLKGAQHLMVDAAPVLNSNQRRTAFAVALEIMRSDGNLQQDEHNILGNLVAVLELDPEQTSPLIEAMNVLHADLGI